MEWFWYLSDFILYPLMYLPSVFYLHEDGDIFGRIM
jgi:hypothetical protein